MGHLLWTFSVVGGEPFCITMEGNPPIEHSGGTSVFHAVATPKQVSHLIDIAERAGCVVRANAPRAQSTEQRAERMALLGVAAQNRVWPSTVCPLCYWFDPLIEDGMPCGAVQWPEEMRRVSLENSKAVADLDACPIRRE
jgi:hypothetical protein